MTVSRDLNAVFLKVQLRCACVSVQRCKFHEWVQPTAAQRVEAASVSPSRSICNHLLKAHYALAHIHRLLGKQKVNLCIRGAASSHLHISAVHVATSAQLLQHKQSPNSFTFIIYIGLVLFFFFKPFHL